MKKILITGANSYIGESFEKHIEGHDELQVDTIDMLDKSWRDRDFSKYDSILHVAGIAHSDSGPISEEKAKLYYAINRDLAVEVAKKAKKEGVTQFVYMSSMIVFGDSAPIGKTKMITNEENASPKNAYGDSKLQAEVELLPLQDEVYNIVVIRPPMVYGQNSKGNYPLLVKFACKLPIFPKVKNERSMIYIGNLCEFIKLVIKNNDSGIFMPQNKEYVNTSRMVQLIARKHNRKIITTSIFNIGLKIISPFVPAINKAFGNLTYDKSLSEYKEEYRIYEFEDTIH